MRFVLFGAGKNGRHLLRKIGSERIAFFLDNNESLDGSFVDGVKVRSFCGVDLMELQEYCVVITVMNKDISLKLAWQLQQCGIERWVFYDMVDDWNDPLPEDIDKKRTAAVLDHYNEIGMRTQRQNEWVRDHIAPKDLKRATGFLRHRQLKIVEFAHSFFESVHEIEIHPVLAYGNLLGLIRHNGFIPWDDDMDFELIRPEYDSFRDYCKGRFFSTKYEGLLNGDDFVNYQMFKKSLFEEHPDEYIYLEVPNHSMILKGNSIFDACSFDIFSLDTYEKDYPFEEHRKSLNMLKEKIEAADDCAQQFDAIYDFIRRDRNRWDPEGTHMFFGADDFTSYDWKMEKDEWLDRSDMFPAVKRSFEGFDFYVPADPEAVLERVYGKRWTKLPPEVGIPDHSFWQEFYRDFCENADIVYNEKYPDTFFTGLYQTLRDKGIYARIVILPGNDRTREEYEGIVSRFDDLGIEHTSSINRSADMCYTAAEDEEYDYIKAKMISYKESEKK